jgi:hypothetical protein
LEDSAFQKLHQQFRTKIDLGIELLDAAVQHKVPFSVLLFDSWYLAEELVSMARYRNKDWISLLKKNRNLETNSFVLKDAAGQPIRLAGPHIAVEDLVPRIPPTAYRAVTVGDKTYWTFTGAVCLPGLGKVRLVVSSPQLPSPQGTPEALPRGRRKSAFEFPAPFKFQLTVCRPKLSDTPGFAKQTVHYFCRLVKGATKTIASVLHA